MVLPIEDAIKKLSQEYGPDFVENGYFDEDVHAAAQRFSESSEWDATAKLLGKHLPGRVLDLGAGRGIATYAFMKAGCEVFPVEPLDSDYLGRGAINKLLSENGLIREASDAVAESLPFPDDYFQIVYCRQLLHHLKDLNIGISEIFRVLQPGGVFFAAREHVVDSDEGLEDFLSEHVIHQLVGGEGAYTLDQYVSAIRGAGFEKIRIFGSYESCINYYPGTEDDVAFICARLLIPTFGFRLSMWMLKSGFLRSRIPLHLLKRYASNRDQRQGRMLSYYCRKSACSVSL